MGRRRRNWDPEGFEKSRNMQRQRQIAPLPSMGSPGRATSTMQPPRPAELDMEAPTSSSSQSAAPDPSRVSRPNANQYLVMSILDNNGQWREGRVYAPPRSKKMGITLDFARELGIFTVPRAQSRIRSIAAGPSSSDRLQTNHSASVTIRNPHPRDPSEEVYTMTVDIWTSESSEPLDYDIRIPPGMRDYSELRDNPEQGDEGGQRDEAGEQRQPVNFGGLEFFTLNGPQDLSYLLEPHQQSGILGDNNCWTCFGHAIDHAMITSNIDMGPPQEYFPPDYTPQDYDSQNYPPM